jgi:phenylalanyl-tRNA synthetase alpha chain
MDLDALVEEALREVAEAADDHSLVQVRARLLGKSGTLTAELRGLGKLPADQRAARGQALNRAKQAIESAVAERQEALRAGDAAARLAGERLDVTLPARGPAPGHLHPLTLVEREMVEIFAGFGFEWVDGPEAETEHYNFESLNIPADHPARDMQDTFYLADGIVLRTHTSPVQIRTMEGREPPLRIITTGRVYRHDADSTHSPMFHQMEAFLVDDRTTFADLKGILFETARRLFGRDVELRFRRSFFPFTEPSGEVDIRGERGWMEILGCGMIHPNVLRAAGHDPARWQGFALGAGIDRIAMLKYGIDSIRVLFENDQRVLDAF